MYKCTKLIFIDFVFVYQLVRMDMDVNEYEGPFNITHTKNVDTH